MHKRSALKLDLPVLEHVLLVVGERVGGDERRARAHGHGVQLAPVVLVRQETVELLERREVVEPL